MALTDKELQEFIDCLSTEELEQFPEAVPWETCRQTRDKISRPLPDDVLVAGKTKGTEQK